MNFNELPAGRYVAKISDWGLEAVESMAGKLKVVIKLDLELPAPNGGFVTGKWDGFVENKDGTPNKKTVKTLVTCGFQDDDLLALNKPGSLDNKKDYEATITKELDKNGVLRTHIDWINLPGGNEIKKATTAKASPAFRAALAQARKEAGVKPATKPKNYAPQTSRTPPPDDDTDEVPF